MWEDLREGSTKFGRGKRCWGPAGGGPAEDGGIPRDGGWEEDEGVGSGPLLYVGTLKSKNQRLGYIFKNACSCNVLPIETEIQLGLEYRTCSVSKW